MSAVDDTTGLVGVDSVKLVENSSNSEESSDDFGNFSDASFDDSIVEGVSQLNFDVYLDKLLPEKSSSKDFSVKNSDGKIKCSLEDLISDERPHVVYEQLVQLRTVLRPFVWSRSHLKSSLWHILNLPEEESLEQKVKKKQDPLNDSLFIEIRSLLNDSNIHTNFILKDHFKIDYYPPLVPVSLKAVEEQDQERRIPKYLTTDIDGVEDLKIHHDTLCHAIDVLFVELRELNKRQLGLVKDKTTFENVVTNLTGHTQRLYRDEIALYNKKVRRKNKFRW